MIDAAKSKNLMKHLREHPRSESVVPIGPINVIHQPGVFDPRVQITGMMIEAMQVPPRARVLDMGCGTGVLGIVAAHRGAKHVTMADLNPFAIKNARANVAFQKLAHAEVVRSDLFDALGARKFDLILFNSPFLYTEEMPDPKQTRIAPDLLRSYFDPGYKLLRRFFTALPKHLSRKGYLQFCFNDAANPELLDQILEACNLARTSLLKRSAPGILKRRITFSVYRIEPATRRRR